MKEDRLNKVPRPKTLARWFSKGKYCDYSADLVCNAVNSHDFQYDSITIPIQLSFYQILGANFEAFTFLYDHNSEDNIKEFLTSPNEFFEEFGIDLSVPFDGDSPKIIASLLEEDVYPLFQSENGFREVIKMDHDHKEGNWFDRHNERYSEKYLSDIVIIGIKGVPYYLKKEIFEEYGFPSGFKSTLNYLLSHLTEK